MKNALKRRKQFLAAQIVKEIELMAVPLFNGFLVLSPITDAAIARMNLQGRSCIPQRHFELYNCIVDFG
ncbi:MAG: hypothetical protein BWX76_00236 [Candidatus Cloacimonetes bacterium ADurb.Bin089]|nr:MAG: hypothetical protein BWX76_00236 [Candidatus Cloacimonetes bacterium ADurb.Bin089]